MAFLSEHAKSIRAAIKAAEADGYVIEYDILRDRSDGSRVVEIDLELHQYSETGDGYRYLANYQLLHTKEW